MEARELETILHDLRHEDEERRRLAVERVSLLPAGQAIPHLVSQLGDPSWRVRKATIDRLAGSPELSTAVRALVAALADGENPGRRNAAVEALVRCGSAAVPVLVEATRDPDVDVRKQVVDALAGIADPAAGDRLVELLGDPDANVRGAAADALGAAAPPGAARALVRAAAEDGEPLVRLSALRALARMEVSVDVADLAGVESDPLLRPAAFALLGVSDDPGALDLLVKGLHASARSAREAAMDALVTLAARGDADEVATRVREGWDAPAAAMEDAYERLVEGPLSTRLALVQFLGLLRPAGAAVPLLRAGADEALEEVVLAALADFGELAEPDIDAAFEGLDAEARLLACEVLGGSRGARGEARLLQALREADPQLRVAAARGLGERGADAALPDLVARLLATGDEDDEDGDDVEESACLAEAIMAIAGRTRAPAGAVERTLALLEERIENAPESFRLAATRILGRIGRPGDVERIQLLMADPDERVRRAAVEAMAQVAPGAFERVRLAMADESPLVRIGAAAALAGCRVGDAIGDLASLAEDEDPLVRAAALRAVGAWARHADPSGPARERALSLLSVGLRRGGAVAVASLEALRQMGGPGVVALAQAGLADGDPEIVQAALACIGAHGSEEELEAMSGLFSHPHWAVRAQSIQIAAERRVVQAVPGILRRLDVEQDDFVRDAILRALEVLES